MKKILSSIIIISLLSFMIIIDALKPVAGAAEDEFVTVNLSDDIPERAVALVPAYDYPSFTIDSTRPANISWRKYNNDLISDFNVLSVENASVEFPFNVPIDIEPVTDRGEINYGDTTWLIFNSTSSESYGEYFVGVNHTAAAIADDETNTFWVDPDFNFHLRIVVSETGPISIRLNTFPAKNPAIIGSRYDNVMLFDPNGALINYYHYMHSNDEYFIFIAESKGNYALIFDPTSQPLFFNVEGRKYKPENLEIEEKVKPIIKGITDSELTDKEKENNPLTFEWFKFSPEEDQVTFTHFEAIRGIPEVGWFSPGINNTGYRGGPGVSVGKARGSDYILVIHDGLARYLIGVEKVAKQDLALNTPEKTKFRAQEYRTYNISISSATSLRVELNTENAGVISYVYSEENNAFITSTQDIGSTIRIINIFAANNFLLILYNSLMKEAWVQLTIERNSPDTLLNFKKWYDMTEPATPDAPNAYKDGERIILGDTDISGVVETQVYHLRSPFADKRFYWQILYGVAFNDSNDLIAQHEGQDIDVKINIDLFTEVDGALQHVSLVDVMKTISNTTVISQGMLNLFFPLTMTSDHGDYWITIDSYMSNGTLLPYRNILRFNVYDITGYYFKATEKVTFTESVAQIQNFEINTSNTRYLITEVPVTWMNWTEVEINYLNGTIQSSPYMLIDFPNYFQPSATVESTSLSYYVFQNPNISSSERYEEIGNISTAFGSATYRDSVFLYLYCSSFAPDYIMSFNMTFRRINTTILSLQKETTVGPEKKAAAPGFEWMIGLLGLGTVVIILTKRKKHLTRK